MLSILVGKLLADFFTVHLLLSGFGGVALFGPPRRTGIRRGGLSMI